MTGFLPELGTKLADRWLAVLLLPGLLFAGIAALAGTLGQRHSLDLHLMARGLATSRRPAPDSPARSSCSW